MDKTRGQLASSIHNSFRESFIYSNIESSQSLSLLYAIVKEGENIFMNTASRNKPMLVKLSIYIDLKLRIIIT